MVTQKILIPSSETTFCLLEKLISALFFKLTKAKFGDLMNKTKNLKVIALILLTSAILLAAIPLPNVAAATQDSMYVYSSIGGTVSTGGTDPNRRRKLQL